jgi:nickel/cobalt transporter (NicO) family protein
MIRCIVSDDRQELSYRRTGMTLRVTAICIAAVVCILSVSAPLGAQNPFTGQRDESPQAAEKDSQGMKPDSSDGAFNVGGTPSTPLGVWLRDQQRRLNARIGELIRGSRVGVVSGTAGTAGTGDGAATDETVGVNRGSGDSVRTVLIIGAVAFLYGLVHAALPGHRKVLLVSYFVATNAPVSHAVLAGVSVAALHSGAAALVVLGAYYVLQTSLSVALDNATLYLQIFTALGVLTVGVVVVLGKAREFMQIRAGTAFMAGPETHGKTLQDTGQDTGRKTGSGHAEADSRLFRRMRSRMGLLPAIVLSAIVPCPGSAMILLFAVSLGVVSLGIFAVTAFSLGMAITLTGVSVIAVVTKRAVTRALDGTLGEFLHIWIEGAGGVVMIAFGTVLLLPFV